MTRKMQFGATLKFFVTIETLEIEHLFNMEAIIPISNYCPLATLEDNFKTTIF